MEIPHLLYADDALLLVISEEELERMVGCFPDVCKRRIRKVNANKVRH